MVDLTVAKEAARACANEWGLTLGEPFASANFSFVAAIGDDRVIKAPWGGDDESLHEGDALEVWRGEGAVRLIRRQGLVLLEERVLPGSDLSHEAEDEATAIAVALARKLWRPAQPPFRAVEPEVWRWLEQAERDGSELVPSARKLFDEIRGGAGWLVHGDFHHHNILRSSDRYAAIDPKPYLSDREYDVPTFLWNPLFNHMEDSEQTERRIAAFVGAGLDDFLIRAWAVIRGSYLRPGEKHARALRQLME